MHTDSYPSLAAFLMTLSYQALTAEHEHRKEEKETYSVTTALTALPLKHLGSFM